MIHRHTNNRPRTHSAFTLMEILMVLGIMGLVVAISIAMFANAPDADGGIHGPPEELAHMAKEASRAAVLLGHSVAIVFDEKGFGMEGTGKGYTSIGKETVIKVQRWNGGKNWTPIKTGRWVFFPSGICDPLRFRFEEPERVVELAFHALTGSVTDQVVLSR